VSKSDHKKKASANILDELRLSDLSDYYKTQHVKGNSRNVFDDMPHLFKSTNSNNLMIGESLINSNGSD
jgi:hypothetical protein